MNELIKRATGFLVIEVVNSNPNGDPDRESDPRQRPNGCGEISPVSFKRKLRDLIDDHAAPFFNTLPEKFRNQDRYYILEHRGRNRPSITAEMKDGGSFLQSTFVKKYWDARVFGNTFLEKEGIKGSSKPGSFNSEWAYRFPRSAFNDKPIPTKPAFRKEKTRVWRLWLTDSLNMAYTACHST